MTPPVPDAVQRVVAPAARFVDVGPLEEAIAGWSATPWRVVVAGRTGVGKSTLINAATGRGDRPTGLNGVTRSVHTTPDGDVEWVDTPGLDGEHRHLVQGALASADAVVWVVDGLQPVTHTERRALQEDLPAGSLVHVVVSRADLVEVAEQAEVLERTRALAAPWRPRTVRLVNLRQAVRSGAHALADLGEPVPWLSRRRRERLRVALAGVATAVADVPPLPDPQAIHRTLIAEWREAVRGAEAKVIEAIGEGRIDHRAIAERRFHELAIAGSRHFTAQARRIAAPLSPVGDPELPEAIPRSAGTLDLPGGLGGAGAALRAIHGLAGRWMAEGQVALQAWLATGADRSADRDALAALRRSLGDAASALDPEHAPRDRRDSVGTVA